MGGAIRDGSVLHWQARLSNVAPGLFRDPGNPQIVNPSLAEDGAISGFVINQEKWRFSRR